MTVQVRKFQKKACLKCNKQFVSKGKFNRLCCACNRDNAKQIVIPLFLFHYDGRVIKKASEKEDVPLPKIRHWERE